jgi:hypothetical protein
MTASFRIVNGTATSGGGNRTNSLFTRRLDRAYLVSETRKPFDVLAEAVSEKSRGDKTPLELFLWGLAGWDAELRRQL